MPHLILPITHHHIIGNKLHNTLLGINNRFDTLNGSNERWVYTIAKNNKFDTLLDIKPYNVCI